MATRRKKKKKRKGKKRRKKKRQAGARGHDMPRFLFLSKSGQTQNQGKSERQRMHAYKKRLMNYYKEEEKKGIII